MRKYNTLNESDYLNMSSDEQAFLETNITENVYNANGVEDCDEIELSNFSNLDTNIQQKFVNGNRNEDYSNFRVFGIGKPSQKQLQRWAAKNPKKVQKLIEKGVINAPNAASAISANSKAIVDGSRVVEKTLKAQGKEEAVTIDAANEENQSSANMSQREPTPTPPAEKKYMGMSKKTGLIVLGVVALGVGTFVYFKYFRKK